jgi:hypothetical protein
VHLEERCAAGGSNLRGAQALEDGREFSNPSCSQLLEVFEDSRLQALQDHVVGPLDLLIGSWVSDGGPIHTDATIITELDELFSSELGDFVGDD